MIIALMGLIILILLAMLSKEKNKNNFVEENQVRNIIEHFKRENYLKQEIVLSEEEEEYLKEEMLYAYKYKNMRTVNKLERYYKELEAKLFKDKLDRVFKEVKKTL
ncbi:hypothetical protein [Clostridium sp. B9]|uniref:hypothetical protein n=1 Tax=Clostridium sp. B9 TaxID=3423224 RepID=UPI003D2F2B1D